MSGAIPGVREYLDRLAETIKIVQDAGADCTWALEEGETVTGYKVRPGSDVVGPYTIGPRVKGWIEAQAAWLKEQHKGGEGQRLLSKYDHDALGLAGEVVFSNVVNCLPGSKHPILEVKVYRDRMSDGGVDFPTRIGTIDVKTAADVKELLVPVHSKKWAQIYVLAGWVPRLWEVNLYGWQYLAAITQSPTGTRHPNGPVNFCTPVDELRPMAALLEGLRTCEQPSP